MWYSTNGKTYDDAYLIIFNVGPLHAHTLAPLILPLLEAPVEGFFWNLLEFGRCIRFDVFHGCEMRLLQAHFQSGEEPKVTRREIRDYCGWVMTGMLFSARNCCTTSDVWLGAITHRAGASNNGRINGASVCVRKGPIMKVIR
jgi:hypothetical protein